MHSPVKVAGDVTESFHSRTQAIPKSDDPARMRQNIDLQGFALSEAEMTRIDGLETGQRFNVDPETAIEANMQMTVPN